MNYEAPSKWTSKPMTIEAWQLTPKNIEAVAEWCGGTVEKTRIGSRVDGTLQETPSTYLLISTLEGTMRASWADVIIKGTHGEFYPCRADIFFAKYEEHIA